MASSSSPNERNRADTRNYSRHYRQRLAGGGAARRRQRHHRRCRRRSPPCRRDRGRCNCGRCARQSVFLDSFGRPDPNQDPPCERTSDTTVVQALHLMNAPNLHRKVTSDTGRAARAGGRASKTPAEIVEELYAAGVQSLAADEEERRTVPEAVRGDRTSAGRSTEDLLWALLNTPEFVFKD